MSCVQQLTASPRELLDQALKVYGHNHDYRPEKARAQYKRSCVLRLLHRVTEADDEALESLNHYRALCPNDTRCLDSFSHSDFDKLVVFWSK